MARTAKLDLRAFQQELATRLASKTAAQVESSRLGLACGGEQWLVRLADAGEVVAVPPVTPVPHTQRWHLGIANVRGNLYSVIDFARYLGRDSTGVGAQSRQVGACCIDVLRQRQQPDEALAAEGCWRRHLFGERQPLLERQVGRGQRGPAAFRHRRRLARPAGERQRTLAVQPARDLGRRRQLPSLQRRRGFALRGRALAERHAAAAARPSIVSLQHEKQKKRLPLLLKEKQSLRQYTVKSFFFFVHLFFALLQNSRGCLFSTRLYHVLLPPGFGC